MTLSHWDGVIAKATALKFSRSCRTVPLASVLQYFSRLEVATEIGRLGLVQLPHAFSGESANP